VVFVGSGGAGSLLNATVVVPVTVLGAILTILTGAVGVIWWCVRRIIAGDMVPRRTYLDMVQDRDFWREAAQERSSQVNKLMEVGEFTAAVIGALERKPRETR
jgi:hypothetical protein